MNAEQLMMRILRVLGMALLVGGLNAAIVTLVSDAPSWPAALIGTGAWLALTSPPPTTSQRTGDKP